MMVALLVLALALSNPVAGVQNADHVDFGHAFKYVVVIVMENQGIADIINSSSAPFLTHLASSFGLATNYTAIAHPSLPNYLAMVSGQDFFSWSKNDCSPSADCTAGSATNLVDSMEGRGLTWKAYMEDYPTSCGSNCSPGGCFMGNGGTGQYAARHDPFVYFGDIVNSSERCSRIVPANSGGSGAPDDLLLSDLSSPSTASNLMWLTPNLCNDMHDCSISTGDTYLSQLVPEILASNLFTDHKAALYITFDEGNGFCPTDGSSRDCVYAVWAGPDAKTQFKSSIPFTHYSFLSTLETVWHLQPLTSNDAQAQPMTEFFTIHHHEGRGDHAESRDRDEGSKSDDHEHSSQAED